MMANFFDTQVSQELPKELKPLATMLRVRATEEAPQFPQRQVADLDPLMQLAYALTQGYSTQGQSDMFTTAVGEAKRTATTPVDVANMPEYQAVVNRIAEYGRDASNRLQRGNILRGNPGWRSSAGRDVLAQNVTETEERMLSAAVPFLQQARAEKQAAINQLMQLEKLGQGTQLSKIGAGVDAGQMMRGVESAKLEAEYQNQMDPLRFRYETQPGLAATAFGSPYAVSAQPSEFEKWVLAIGSIVGSIREGGKGYMQGGIGGAILGGMKGFAEGGYEYKGNIEGVAGTFGSTSTSTSGGGGGYSSAFGNTAGNFPQSAW